MLGNHPPDKMSLSNHHSRKGFFACMRISIRTTLERSDVSMRGVNSKLLALSLHDGWLTCVDGTRVWSSSITLCLSLMVHAFMYIWPVSTKCMHGLWMATNPCKPTWDVQEQNVPERMFRFESNVVPEENKANRAPPYPASARGEPYLYLESFDLKAARFLRKTKVNEHRCACERTSEGRRSREAPSDPSAMAKANSSGVRWRWGFRRDDGTTGSDSERPRVSPGITPLLALPGVPTHTSGLRARCARIIPL